MEIFGAERSHNSRRGPLRRIRCSVCAADCGEFDGEHDVEFRLILRPRQNISSTPTHGSLRATQVAHRLANRIAHPNLSIDATRVADPAAHGVYADGPITRYIPYAFSRVFELRKPLTKTPAIVALA